jgi:protein phosphatase 1 regulatory subunit 7
MSEQELFSGTDEEIEDVVDTQDQGRDDEPLPVEYPGTVLPDHNVQEIGADQDLTKNLPDDTEYIELIHLKISNLEDLNLERFQSAEAICLRQNLVKAIGGLKVLNPDKIEEIDFYDNRINHISSSVSKFVHLKSLDLSFNNIKTIQNIDTLGELENLYFVQNKIKQIQNLENLKSLKNLELGGNKIEHISDTLGHLPNLTQLWLGKNRIPRLENLTNLTNLKILSIQSNRITKIEGLEGLVNLEELYISHNGIEKIENLENNKKLTVLDVTSNKLTKLENLSHLTKLTDFWCSYNGISSFEEIGKELGKLPELETVYFEGNPVQLQNPTAYRRKIMLYLDKTKLEKIDATYIKS